MNTLHIRSSRGNLQCDISLYPIRQRHLDNHSHGILQCIRFASRHHHHIDEAASPSSSSSSSHANLLYSVYILFHYMHYKKSCEWSIVSVLCMCVYSIATACLDSSALANISASPVNESRQTSQHRALAYARLAAARYDLVTVGYVSSPPTYIIVSFTVKTWQERYIKSLIVYIYVHPLTVGMLGKRSYSTKRWEHTQTKSTTEDDHEQFKRFLCECNI